MLLEDLNLTVNLPMTMECDSRNARLWAMNAQVTHRNKHIGLRYHYVRELIENGTIRIVSIDTTKNRADILTKNLPPVLFNKHREALEFEIKWKKPFVGGVVSVVCVMCLVSTKSFSCFCVVRIISVSNVLLCQLCKLFFSLFGCCLFVVVHCCCFLWSLFQRKK